MLSALMLSALLSTSPARALPQPGISASLGVNIHFTDPKPGEMQLLAKGGFKWIRMDFNWGGTEVTSGKYDFSAYDRLMAALKPHDIHPIFILDYSNKNYDNDQSPASPMARTAFAKWAAAASLHFKGMGVVWEMYNEPNIFFWRPKPNVNDYALLAVEVGKAIRAVTPDETYIGPATSGIDLNFIETCFKAGCLKYWDAVSVHPYRQSDPETVSTEYRKLRLLIEKYKPANKIIPIVSGEWGYSSAWSSFDDVRQGKYAPREMLTNLINDIPISIWYDWHDDGTDVKEPEHHFGTVKFPYMEGQKSVYEAKDSFKSIQTLSKELEGYVLNKRLWTGKETDYDVLLTRGNEIRRVCWTTSKVGSSIVMDGAYNLKNYLGIITEILDNKAGATLVITDSPVYMTPSPASDNLKLIAAWERCPSVISFRRGNAPRLQLTTSNPLSKSVRINGKSCAPGKSIKLDYMLKVSDQDLEESDTYAVLNIDGIDVAKQIIRLRQLNALHASLIPLGNAKYQVRVGNPSGEPFNGKVELKSMDGDIPHSELKNIAFNKGELETTIGITTRSNISDKGKLILNILDAKTAPIFHLPAIAFKPISNFDEEMGQYKWFVDGDPKIKSEFSLLPTESELPDSSHGKSLKLTYRADTGWKFVRVAPPETSRTITGTPTNFGIWVYGDGNGNLPRLRFTDASGQTFQPAAPAIDWKGWRYITFTMTGKDTSFWGGDNNGIVKYPIHWDSMFLLDMGGKESSGEIALAVPCLSYE